MDNQDLLNKTANRVLAEFVKYLKPADESDDDLMPSEEKVVAVGNQVNYPKAKDLENFMKKLAVYVILKLENNKYFFIETKNSPQGEFGNLVLSSGIDPRLFPKSTTMKISLGFIEITDFMGQENVIKIS